MRVLPIGRFRAIAVLLFLLCSTVSARASHIFGIDLYYTHVTGNTYKIYLVVYGDCAGAAFSSLPTSSPVIEIYNAGTYVSAINLTVQAPATGIEVTPVCPSQAGNTTCVNTAGTIPGVKKFVYAGNVTVSGASAAWRFLFAGNMGGATAGRSNSITNILIGGAGSTIQLVDTLNNTTYNNSSSVYTTIPTPFYCINQPANFNPGAVDPDGDSLVYHLVPGVDAATGTSVSYIAPYTAAAPIGATAGTFSFSASTGQLSFTPNITQKALVVYNVEEYSGGVLRGTTQREMTVVVLSPCTNNPPTGSLSAASGGTLVSGTQLNICANTGAFTVGINPTDPDGDSITMSVAGLPTGATFNIVNNGSTAPLGTFSWNTTGVTLGSYTFYVTYQDNGCPLSSKQTIAYTITILPVPTQSVSIVSAVTCIAKAVLHITPGGSSSPYSVKVLEGSATVHSFTGVTGMMTDSLSAGTYTIRTYNADGCYADTAITLTVPNLPTPAVTTTTPLCPGGSTGSATITGTGGVTPYTYAIGTGAYSSTNVFSSLSAGSYTLHIKDANGCVKDTTITVPDATPILVNATIVKPLCNDFANGSVTLTAYNSVAPYTYATGSGSYSSTNLFSGLAAGTYTFHIKNANGCAKDTSITLVDSLHLDATLAISGVLCNGGTATVTVTGTGSATAYTYAYNSTVYSTINIFYLVAGAYTVHVKDANACYFDTSLTLTQPAAGAVTATPHNVSCNGGTDGSVTVSASGGTPSYTYSIAGGVFGSSGAFSSLPAGTYAVQVKDANGCIYPDTITLTQPTAIAIDSVSLHIPSCNGSADGYAHIYAHGGTPSYTYASGAGAYSATAVISSLSAGSYTLHVKDANGCIKDTTITLGQPTAIVPHAIVRSSVCNTLANGQVTLSATGGTAGYTYATGSGSYSTLAVFAPLAAGSYTFHIKDANGCVKDTAISVSDSLHVSGTFTITPALCYGSATGTITVNGTGGTSPYTYAIGSGAYAAANLFSSLPSASYAIHIKDNNGCTDDTSVLISQPAFIVPHITITQPSCHGYSDGVVAVSATGGTPAYQYSFDNGAFSTAISYTSLPAGADTLVIKDNNSCLHDTTFTIQQPTALMITGIAITNVSCNGGSDGTVTITASGATPAYMYDANTAAWQYSDALTGLNAGIEAIQVKDSHGCTADTTATVTQPQVLVFSSVDTVNPTCQGYTDGSVKLHMAGGATPYQYSIDNVNFSTANAFAALAEGTYTFYVKDANGCTADTTITLTGYPHIIINDVSVTAATCFGLADGLVAISASGGVAPLYYQISTGSGSSVADTFGGLASSTYIFTVTDSKNCKEDTSVYVSQPGALSISFQVTPNECEGAENKGAILASVNGGTAPYKYTWSADTVNKNAAYISGLANGTYTISVTDTNGCAVSDTAEVKYNNCCNPFIPNAFTPNNDGKDDVFRIRFKGDMQLIEFSVYNRFGERVFFTKDFDKGWDGTYNGAYADMGTYFYFARIICGNSNTNVTMLKGDVTLVR